MNPLKHLTRRERQLFDFLSDGQPHSRTECMDVGLKAVPYADHKIVAVFVHHLRRKVSTLGYQIFNDSPYRQVEARWRLQPPSAEVVSLLWGTT